NARHCWPLRRSPGRGRRRADCPIAVCRRWPAETEDAVRTRAAHDHYEGPGIVAGLGGQCQSRQARIAPARERRHNVAPFFSPYMWKVLPVTQKPDQCLGEWIDREAL